MAAIAELVEVAEGVVAALEAIRAGKDVFDQARANFDSFVSKFKSVFGSLTYISSTSKVFAFSQIWIDYRSMMLILNKMQKTPFSLPDQVKFLQSLFSLLFSYDAVNMFTPTFPADRYFACLSLDDDVVKLTLNIQRALGYKKKEGELEFQLARDLYYKNFVLFLTWANNKKNIYDRERFETEFNLELS